MPTTEPPQAPTNPIRTVGLIAKPGSEHAVALVPQLIAWLTRRGLKLRMDETTAAYANPDTALLRPKGLPREDVADGADLLVVLGGDGTLLSAARACVGHAMPVLAVNLGALGFLTAITIDELYPQLEQVLHGEYETAPRRMLHTELWRRGVCISRHEALNDVVLTKSEIARMIELEVFIDGHFVCVYRADGLIVATPTGSTAYSLSAGGPIMIPSVSALAITPICPHMLTNRPVIVPDENEIQIHVSGTDPTYMTIDGQVGEMLAQGDRVHCRRSQHSIHLVRPPGKLLFDVLREKLGWGGR